MPDEPAKPKRKQRAISMFRDRLKSEGRLAEFEKYTRELHKKNNNKPGIWSRCVWWAAEEFGYKGPKEEHRLYEQRMKATPEGKYLLFEMAMAELPPTADMQIENDWVTTHPKVTRLTRGADKIDWEPMDLFDTPNGRCPSMRAANRLVLHAQYQRELHAKLSEGIKKNETQDRAAEKNEVVQDMGLEELERQLEEMGRG